MGRKHEKIRKKFLLLLDGQLPTQDEQEVRTHLEACRRCAAAFARTRKVWLSDPLRERREPPATLWPGIQSRLRHNRQRERRLPIRQPAPVARVALAGAIMMAALFFGIFLGERYLAASTARETAAADAEEEMAVLFNLHSLEDLPPGSIVNAYFDLTHANAGGQHE